MKNNDSQYYLELKKQRESNEINAVKKKHQ